MTASTPDLKTIRLSVAPMMDWTDLAEKRQQK